VPGGFGSDAARGPEAHSFTPIVFILSKKNYPMATASRSNTQNRHLLYTLLAVLRLALAATS
jgi:hypothetical protein